MTESLHEKSIKRLDEAASSPKKVEVDNQTVEQHSLYEQIALDKYLASKDASRRRGFGIRVAKISPPSAI